MELQSNPANKTIATDCISLNIRNISDIPKRVELFNEGFKDPEIFIKSDSNIISYSEVKSLINVDKYKITGVQVTVIKGVAENACKNLHLTHIEKNLKGQKTYTEFAFRLDPYQFQNGVRLDVGYDLLLKPGVIIDFNIQPDNELQIVFLLWNTADGAEAVG